jgi:hypothetical protein
MSTHSQDNMSNTPVSGDPFSDLKKALAENVQDVERRARLLAAVDDMRAAQGQGDFAEAYRRFVALTEGNVGVAGPYFARFANMIVS